MKTIELINKIKSEIKNGTEYCQFELFKLLYSPLCKQELLNWSFCENNESILITMKDNTKLCIWLEITLNEKNNSICFFHFLN